MNDVLKDKYAVPALDKGLDILEYLVNIRIACTQTEIARGVKRSPNEIYRVLVGLEKRGYLQRDINSGRYSLSLKLFHLSRNISPIDRVRQSALPFMEDLAVHIGQSCYLSMLYQSQAMVVVNARSTSQVHLSISEGAMFNLSQSTAGKLLLANSNEEVAAMLIEQDPHYRLYSHEQLTSLKAELNTICQAGYTTQKNQLIGGVEDYSVFIGKGDSKVMAALTISTLDSPQSHSANSDELIHALITTAGQITQLIAE